LKTVGSTGKFDSEHGGVSVVLIGILSGRLSGKRRIAGVSSSGELRELGSGGGISDHDAHGFSSESEGSGETVGGDGDGSVGVHSPLDVGSVGSDDVGLDPEEKEGREKVSLRSSSDESCSRRERVKLTRPASSGSKS